MGGVPDIKDLAALGLIVTCVNSACRQRRWIDIHNLPPRATVQTVATNGRCSSCGGLGAHVEVVQPLAEIGEQRGRSGPRNIEHAAQLRKYIEEHPVSLWGARSRRSSSDVQ